MKKLRGSKQFDDIFGERDNQLHYTYRPVGGSKKMINVIQ